MSNEQEQLMCVVTKYEKSTGSNQFTEMWIDESLESENNPMIHILQSSYETLLDDEYKRARREVIAEVMPTIELIAAPKRVDGTYNRCREACEQLARDLKEKLK